MMKVSRCFSGAIQISVRHNEWTFGIYARDEDDLPQALKALNYMTAKWPDEHVSVYDVLEAIDG